MQGFWAARSCWPYHHKAHDELVKPLSISIYARAWANVGIVTVHQFESGVSQPRRATLDVIRRAFESAGVEFIDENGGGPGLRLRKRHQKKS